MPAQGFRSPAGPSWPSCAWRTASPALRRVIRQRIGWNTGREAPRLAEACGPSDGTGSPCAVGRDEADIVEYLERQKQYLEAKMRQYRNIAVSLDHVISTEREAKNVVQESTFEVQEKALEPMLIAGFRMKGRYSDCGKGFARIGRAFGRQICGPMFNLYYDGEYREDDADLETCAPIRKGKEVEGISVRELPGGHCVAILHRGPWDQLGRSYAKILAYVKQKGYKIALPSREVYLKGPGMIFKGNPKKYLTEIQMLIETQSDSV